MSGPYPGSYKSYSQTASSPPGNLGSPGREADKDRKRGQVLGSMMQNASPVSNRQTTNVNTTQIPSPVSQISLSSATSRGAGGPVLPLSPGHEVPIERQTSRSPTSVNSFTQSPIGYEASTSDRRTSGPSQPVQRKPSAFDKVSQENAQLRQELANLRITRDDTQAACDNMLTELINTQESLQESEATSARKDEELADLRKQLTVLTAELRGAYPESLRAGQRNDDRELRELRLKCSRLMKEAETKDEQLRQAKASALETSMNSVSINNNELHEAREAAHRAARHAQSLQEDANKYIQQLHDWKLAYDNLSESHNKLQRVNADLSQAAHTAKSKVDDGVLNKMQAAHAAELQDLKKMSDFFKQNSEQQSRRTKAVTEQNRNLQDSLDAKGREVEQQRSMIEALQVQMR